MLCFCCSQGLKDWEDNDEPWTEHARWSPTCSYVLLCKGKTFVEEACGALKIENFNHEARIDVVTLLKTSKLTYQLFYRFYLS
jgi:hypothetical protein